MPSESLLHHPPVVVYPESDGAPMGETEWHVFALAGILQALQEHFRARPDVHVGGNLFLYFEEGDPHRVVCPDVFVAFGAAPGLRRTWKTWDEGGLFPQVILELLSESTRRLDLGPKRDAYARLGVEEYFAYEPPDEFAEPRLRGFRRAHGELLPLLPTTSAKGRAAILSERLGLVLEDEGDRLRFRDVATGEALLYPDELAAARREEQAEIERLRALLGRRA